MTDEPGTTRSHHHSTAATARPVTASSVSSATISAVPAAAPATTAPPAQTPADDAGMTEWSTAQAQRLRLQRVGLAAAIYALCCALLLLFHWQGAINIATPLVVAIIIAAVVLNAGFLLWIYSGRNLQRRDPSMTLPQMLAATLWCYVPIALTPELRAEMLMMYSCVFFFGCFRLQRQQFLLVAAFALIGYAGILLLDPWLHGQAAQPAREIIRFILLTVVLLILSMLGGTIYTMRQQLRQQHRALQQANAQIRLQATIDALTGLHNRRVLIEALQREEARARRRGTVFSVIMCDLDHFKQINDQYGHLAGDSILKLAAETMLAKLRTADWLTHGGDEMVARYGGEEFAILLPDTDASGALRCAERLRSALREASLPTPLTALQLTASFGVAQYRGTADNPAQDNTNETVQELLQRADQALYAAKHGGRDQVQLAP